LFARNHGFGATMANRREGAKRHRKKNIWLIFFYNSDLEKFCVNERLFDELLYAFNMS
jgi:hypothetical protein